MSDLTPETLNRVRYALHVARTSFPFAHPDGHGGVTVEPATAHVAADDLEALLDTLAAEKARADRHGPCICNTGPGTEGPDEFCPQHGRTYADVLTRWDEADARADKAEQERDEYVRLRDEWAKTAQQARARVAALEERLAAVGELDYLGRLRALEARIALALECLAWDRPYDTRIEAAREALSLTEKGADDA